jgi:hypothetical protein
LQYAPRRPTGERHVRARARWWERGRCGLEQRRRYRCRIDHFHHRGGQPSDEIVCEKSTVVAFREIVPPDKVGPTFGATSPTGPSRLLFSWYTTSRLRISAALRISIQSASSCTLGSSPANFRAQARSGTSKALWHCTMSRSAFEGSKPTSVATPDNSDQPSFAPAEFQRTCAPPEVELLIDSCLDRVGEAVEYEKTERLRNGERGCGGHG